MRSLVRAAAIGLLAWAVGGCTTLVGGAGGTQTGLAPSTPGTSAALSLLQPLDGGLVGRAELTRLSRADRIAALQTEYRTLEYTAPGDLVTWQGSGGSIAGDVVASQPYRVGTQDCRQYTHTIRAGGEPAVIRGTACRNPDGSWTLLS